MKNGLLKIFIFLRLKILCIFHGHVFVLMCSKFKCCQKKAMTRRDIPIGISLHYTPSSTHV